MAPVGGDVPRLAAAQAPAAPNPTFRTSVNLVSSDVIVRNRRGQFQADLTRDDFEVYEDGIKQELSSFTLVHGGRVLGVSLLQGLCSVVAVAFVWQVMLNPQYGVLNHYLVKLPGIGEPIDFLGLAPWALITVIAFLIGLVPMWLLHRATRWNSERRSDSITRVLSRR